MKNLVNYLEAPLPEKTRSYMPVSHRDLLDFVGERLDVAGFKASSPVVNQNNNGEMIIANMDVSRPDIKSSNAYFKQQLVVVNSYDKSKPIMFASGAQVFVCSNGMVISEMTTVRRHTTNVWNELEGKADEAIGQLLDNWNKTIFDVNQMRKRDMGIIEMAETMGRIYVEKQLLTPTEMSAAVREIQKPTFADFTDRNLWSLYNACTFALKDAHPYRKNESLKGLHDFCLELTN